MKEKIQKIIAITMCALMLASTISWKVEKHYCMGHLVDIALFSEAKTCGMDMSTETVSGEKEKSCCDDEVILVQGQDDLKQSLNDITLVQKSFLIAFTSSYLTLFNGIGEQPVPDHYYPPPLLVKDIQLFDQVFLI